MRRFVLALLSTLGVLGASFLLGNAQANAVSCFANEGFRTYYWAANGAGAVESTASVYANITTRQYGTCTGGLPEAVDAAVAIYNVSAGSVTAVDAHSIQLYANNNTPRTNTCFGCPDGGEPTRGFTYTPSCSVSPFGSGSYFAWGWVQWRQSNGNLVVKNGFASYLGPARYSTIESIPCS